MLKNLERFGFDPILLEETKNWNPQGGKKFNIKKDQSVHMPPHIQQIKFGLGWESRCDIDASLILMDAHG